MNLQPRMEKLISAVSDGMYEREEIIAVALLGALCGQNTFLYGPPGTAKSLISRRIACAFAKRPDVLILDEPTSGLDGRNMRRIADALDLLAGRGACVLVITHDLELMGLSCARALRLPLS